MKDRLRGSSGANKSQGNQQQASTPQPLLPEPVELVWAKVRNDQLHLVQTAMRSTAESCVVYTRRQKPFSVQIRAFGRLLLMYNESHRFRDGSGGQQGYCHWPKRQGQARRRGLCCSWLIAPWRASSAPRRCSMCTTIASLAPHMATRSVGATDQHAASAGPAKCGLHLVRAEPFSK
jgi:hypothetical protein